ncbi:hypothetical protein LLG46_02805 [bacterium]|nr:hypothetical protein [bacterium]
MKCTDAREIVQNSMDGDQCPNARLAYEHIAECTDCQKWKSGMEAILAAANEAVEAIPNIDISTTVMARLPEHHPASAEYTGKHLLALAAASWFAGAAILVAVLSIWMTVNGISLTSLPTLLYSSVKELVIFINTIISSAGAAAIATIGKSAPTLREFAVKMKPLMLFTTATDIGLIIAGYLLWTHRKTITGLNLI